MTCKTLLAAALLATLATSAGANGVKIDWEHGSPIAGDGAPMLSKLCESNPGLAICGPFFNTVPPIFRRPGTVGISNGFIIQPRTPIMLPSGGHRPVPMR